MSATAKQLFATWSVGVLIGSAVIAITSPLFLRSYVPQRVDSVREIYTLAQTPSYRWRSEGYADSVIGPLGMPGRGDLPDADANSLRVALWGDSQAEGFAVSDEDKIYAQTERLAGGDSKKLVVLPFARSGEDVSDWVPQVSRVDAKLAIDVHVILVAELIDLVAADDSRDRLETANVKSEISGHFPSFVIQAARNVLTTGESTSPRRLRFTIGPVAKTSSPASGITASETDVAKVDWPSIVHVMTGETKKPVVLVYAPVLPSIAGGKIFSVDDEAIEFERLQQAAQLGGMVVVDLRADFFESATRDDWPHGFHNGQFGSGHLNRIGNEIVARGIVRGVEQALQHVGEGSN